MSGILLNESTESFKTCLKNSAYQEKPRKEEELISGPNWRQREMEDDLLYGLVLDWKTLEKEKKEKS